MCFHVCAHTLTCADKFLYPTPCSFTFLKGRFSSGLEGASAKTYFGDLTGKQPCELMHNNHNQVKIKLV